MLIVLEYLKLWNPINNCIAVLIYHHTPETPESADNNYHLWPCCPTVSTMPLRLWPGRIYSPAGTISVTLLKDLFLSSMYNYFCLTAHLVFMPGTYGD